MKCSVCGTVMWRSVTGMFCPDCRSRVVAPGPRNGEITVLSHSELQRKADAEKAKAEVSKFVEVVVSRRQTAVVYMQVPGDFDWTTNSDAGAFHTAVEKAADSANLHWEEDWGVAVEVDDVKETTHKEAAVYGFSEYDPPRSSKPRNGCRAI